MLIRDGQRRDVDEIAEFQLAMALETEELVLDPATVRAGVMALFDDPRRGRYLVAEGADGKLVASLMTLPEWSDWRNGTVLWIHSVYVVPAARGQGIYRQMYARLQTEVRESADLRGLRLYVDNRNLAAQKVYERLGMNGDHYRLYEWLDED